MARRSKIATSGPSTLLARVRGGTGQTFASLVVPEYRLLWLGMLFSIGAMQIDVIARAWLAYDLSGSGLALGMVTAARGLPQIILAPFSGVAADRFDKRRILVISQLAIFLLATTNAILVHSGAIQVWHLALLGLLQGFASPFLMSTRTAAIPDLLPERHVSNALALDSTGRNLNRIVAPSFAGLLLAFNPTLAFYSIAIIYGLAVITLYNLPGGLRGESEQDGALREMWKGFAYIYSRPPLFALIALAFVPVLLGMPFQSLLPIFQVEVLGVGERSLGFMYTAIGLGAITGSVIIAYYSETTHKNRIQIGSGVLFGLLLTAFALSSHYPTSMVLLVLVGLASTGYLTLNRVLIAEQTERHIFGRVMSIYGMTWSLMPIALLPFGAMVDVVGVQATVAGAGLLLAVVVAATAMVFARYYLHTPTPPVVEVAD